MFIASLLDQSMRPRSHLVADVSTMKAVKSDIHSVWHSNKIYRTIFSHFSKLIVQNIATRYQNFFHNRVAIPKAPYFIRLGVQGRTLFEVRMRRCPKPLLSFCIGRALLA